MHMLKRSAAASCFALFFLIALSPSTAPCADGPESKPSHPFSIQLISGLLDSPVIHRYRTDLDYALVDVRFGWLLGPNAPSRKLGLSGPFEMVFGLTYGSVVDGPGNYFTGVTALVRYYFFSHGDRFRPYVQLGAGIVYNDIYEDKAQEVIGQSIEFTPQGSLGMHFFVNTNWALDAEIMYHHISNAGLDDRNEGVNSLGGLIGVTYCF